VRKAGLRELGTSQVDQSVPTTQCSVLITPPLRGSQTPQAFGGGYFRLSTED
jgi:hypothetical protein